MCLKFSRFHGLPDVQAFKVSRFQGFNVEEFSRVPVSRLDLRPSKPWNLELLKTLKPWNLETLKPWNLETLNLEACLYIRVLVKNPRFQGFKVSRFQGSKVSRFPKVSQIFKVPTLRTPNLFPDLLYYHSYHYYHDLEGRASFFEYPIFFQFERFSRLLTFGQKFQLPPICWNVQTFLNFNVFPDY